MCCAYRSPGYDKNGHPPRRPHEFENNVARYLEQGVREEEYGQCHVVLSRGKLEVHVHARDSGVSNVGSIHEGENVEDREERQQSPVNFGPEFLDLAIIVLWDLSRKWLAFLLWSRVTVKHKHSTLRAPHVSQMTHRAQEWSRFCYARGELPPGYRWHVASLPC